ncbi:MAG: FtsX-like permease family protein [Sellimonas intestinalis]
MSDGILLIVGGALTAIFLIVSFGVFLTAGAIPQIPGIPRWLLRLQGIFQGATVMIIFLCVLLMYNLISNYTKVRNREYRTFLVLGIRTRTIYLLFAVEFGVSMILSAVTGLCSGGLVYTLIRHVLKDRIALPPFSQSKYLDGAESDFADSGVCNDAQSGEYSSDGKFNGAL